MKEQSKNRLIEETIAEGLCNILGKQITLKQIFRERFSGSSSFATERIRVLMDNGEWVNIFFKDLNPDNQLEEARKIRDAGLERSRREMLVYLKILAQLHLDTPKLFGYRWDPDADIYWIFLEDIGPKRLSRLGDFSLWVEAARWAARLHAADSREIMKYADFLPYYNSEHFLECSQQLSKNITNFNYHQQRVIHKVLDYYNSIYNQLISLPLFLIHGEYFGKNIMIRPGKTDNAIAVIDWETAAFGPRCIDLVSISAGRWTPEQRDIMYKAYAEQFKKETGKVVDTDILKQEIRHVAIYRALWWLGYWSKGDNVHINRWFKELEAVM